MIQKSFSEKICIGTANFGQKYGLIKNHMVSEKEIAKILDYCNKNNIYKIDTAIGYGDAEKKLGNIGIKNWKVVSKFPPIINDAIGVGNWIEKNLEKTLKNLKVDNLHGILLHRASDLSEKNSDIIYEKLISLKKYGLISKIGVSIYSPETLEKITQNYKLDLLQAPYNIFDRRIKKTGWLKKLTKMNLKIQVRSVFLQGLLLQKSKDLPKYFLKWKPLWESFERWCTLHNFDKKYVCLKFILKEKELSDIIIGIDGLQQLKDINEVFINQKHIPDINIYSNDKSLIDPINWGN